MSPPTRLTENHLMKPQDILDFSNPPDVLEEIYKETSGSSAGRVQALCGALIKLGDVFFSLLHKTVATLPLPDCLSQGCVLQFLR